MTKNSIFCRRSFAGIRKFAAARDAAAALEFALIMPLLAGIVVTLDDVANIAVGAGEMQTASRSAIQYAMNGGTDMDTAQSLGLQAWNKRPSDGTLTAGLACYCNATASACDQPCADGNPPQSFVTVTVSGTFGGNMITKTETLSEKVRLR